ncbi:septum formation family protein [Amycolatopsis nigrescens]|uniref:septum formation family protein n=1 Tax=Amycolatopsis nigrescens TaxID=381445 RepID=UPI000361E0A5|nr:septum formation family protein [Amycolatopsis nigrescens]
MSDEPGRFRTAKHTLRTRLVMAGVFVGALLALGLSVTFSWSNDVKGGGGGGKAEMSKAAKEAFHSPTGSCLTWAQPDAGDIHKVSCAEPHLSEVTGVVDIADRYPPGAPSPDLQLWREIANERCTDGTEAYLGKPLDPEGKLTISALRPGDDEWAAGDRQLRCVLQWAGPGGKLQTLTGPAAEQPQSNVWPTGSCLALTGKVPGDPIDCAQPHAYEMVAELDLKEKFSDYPDEDEQKAYLDTECNKALEEYTGGTDLAAQKVILAWDLRSQESWDAGSTTVNCKVGAKLEDGSGLAPVTGSVKKAPDPTSAPMESGTDQSSPAPSSSSSGG